MSAAIHSDHFPDNVIEGTSHVVDGIAYYKGERVRKLFDVTDADKQLASLRIGLDVKAVRFLGNESSELPLEVRNVILGPVDFCFALVNMPKEPTRDDVLRKMLKTPPQPFTPKAKAKPSRPSKAAKAEPDKGAG